MSAAGPDTRLFLIFATDAHGAGLESLEAALAAGGPTVACVLFRPNDDALGHSTGLQSAIRRVQVQDVAVLIANDAELARALGADGVHLDAVSVEAEARSRYAIARATLGSERTVGASAGLSRHMAMVLGEMGADYVAFEEESVVGRSSLKDPNDKRPMTKDHHATACETAGDLATWWVPLFEVPVVALGVASAAEADRLAAAGVDFIGVTVDEGPDAARHVARMAEALTSAGSAL